MASRHRNPLHWAFTATALGILFMTSGVFGYTLDRHERFVTGTPWVNHVIWWQVGVGAAALLLSAWFWRAGLHWLHESSDPRRHSR